MPPADAWSSCWVEDASSAVDRAVGGLATWSGGTSAGLQLLLGHTVIQASSAILLAIRGLLLLCMTSQSADHRCLDTSAKVSGCSAAGTTRRILFVVLMGNDLLREPAIKSWRRGGSPAPPFLSIVPIRRFAPSARFPTLRRDDDPPPRATKPGNPPLLWSHILRLAERPGTCAISATSTTHIPTT